MIVVFILLVIVGGIFWFVMNTFDIDMKPIVNKKEIVFKEISEKVYVRAMSWGVAGNHNEIIFSNEPITPINRKSEKERDYIFYTSDLYYKRQGMDTLLIYAESSSIGNSPEVKFNKVKIIAMGIKTYDESLDYERNYKKYGLEKISVYQ